MKPFGIPELKGPASTVWNERAENGRPFGEANASPECRKSLEFRYAVCGYPGSRIGKPMNVSALKEITENWSAILANLDFVRTSFLARNKVSSFNKLLFWRFAKLVVGVPGFLVRRGWLAKDIPEEIAGLFKAGQGLYMTIERLLMAGASVNDLDAPITVAEFLEATEKHEVFINSAAAPVRVCSGPPHLVTAFVNVAVHGLSSPAAPFWATLTDEMSLIIAYEESAHRLELLTHWLHAKHAAIVDACVNGLQQLSSLPDAVLTWNEARRRLEGFKAPLEIIECILAGDLPVPVELDDDESLEAFALARRGATQGDSLVLDHCLASWLSYVACERAAITCVARHSERLDGIFGSARGASPAVDSSVWGAEVPAALNTLMRDWIGLTSTSTPRRTTFRAEPVRQ